MENILLGLVIGNFVGQIIVLVMKLVECRREKSKDEKHEHKKTCRNKSNKDN